MTTDNPFGKRESGTIAHLRLENKVDQYNNLDTRVYLNGVELTDWVTVVNIDLDGNEPFPMVTIQIPAYVTWETVTVDG